MSDGHPARVRSLNIVGLGTSQVHPMASLSPETIGHLKRAYRTLFRSKVNLTQAITEVKSEGELDTEVEYLLNFIENSNRGIGV